KVVTKETTKDNLINMMVGRTVYEDPKQHSEVNENAEVVLSVRHLNKGTDVKDVSFDLHRGEILGFSGLMGAGITEVARLMLGADRKDSGDIYVHDEQVDIREGEDAIRQGIGDVSEDRTEFGVVVGV